MNYRISHYRKKIRKNHLYTALNRMLVALFHFCLHSCELFDYIFYYKIHNMLASFIIVHFGYKWVRGRMLSLSSEQTDRSELLSLCTPAKMMKFITNIWTNGS